MSSKAARTKINVSPSPDGWRVERAGAKRADSVHQRKEQAVERATEIGRKLGERGHAQVIIRKADGTIQSERTYGGDPYPPKG